MTEPNAKPWADLAAYRAEHARRNPVPDVGQVVAGLAERKQWLIWRYEPGETPDKKPRKMPYYVGKNAGMTSKGRSRIVPDLRPTQSRRPMPSSVGSMELALPSSLAMV